MCAAIRLVLIDKVFQLLTLLCWHVRIRFQCFLSLTRNCSGQYLGDDDTSLHDSHSKVRCSLTNQFGHSACLVQSTTDFEFPFRVSESLTQLEVRELHHQSFVWQALLDFFYGGNQHCATGVFVFHDTNREIGCGRFNHSRCGLFRRRTRA
ncbi:hypothetical protein AO062_20055 [Variovorax boronicumulans]|nr:hypothetical protein AO062_20055 [Variovorax boronicumulans]